MFIVCSEHLEQAIDEFVEAYEASPDIHLLSDIAFKEWTAPHSCEFCSQPPKYLVV